MTVSIPDDARDGLWIRDLLDGRFAIDDITTGIPQGASVRIRGQFLIPSAEAYAQLAPRCRAMGRTLLFRHEEGSDVILLLDGIVRPSRNNRWVPALLALATVLSVVFSFTFYWQMSELTIASFLQALPSGLVFAGGLLTILVTHEFGHYLMARHFQVAVSLPYLIPFPVLSPFGTLGAVIRMKDVPPSRRAMLFIGAAGPLAGLAVGIPVLLWGLALSSVEVLPQGGYSLEGNSLLYAGLKFLMFGRFLPSGGQDVMLHPLAFAGWAGLLVTGLNLVPAGQLDGGHVVYALLGEHARYVTWGMIALLLVLGIWWQGWLLWAAVVFLLARKHAQPLDDLSPLDKTARLVAIGILVLFVLTFTPFPLQIVSGA